jgi:dimethylargininase
MKGCWPNIALMSPRSTPPASRLRCWSRSPTIQIRSSSRIRPSACPTVRPGAPARIGEAAEIAPALRRRFARILVQDEGFADGGDMLILPNEILIGLSARTDQRGAERVGALLDELGCAARIVRTPPGVLHLKTACALIDEETVIVTPALASTAICYRLRVLETPVGEEKAANLLRLNETLLIGADYPRTAELLAGRVAKLLPLAIAENRKIDAGLSCMSLRW